MKLQRCLLCGARTTQASRVSDYVRAAHPKERKRQRQQ